MVYGGRDGKENKQDGGIKMIELGDKVRCIHTGFTGIAIARTEFINGCVQYSVAPNVGKDNKYPEEFSLDEDSLEVISPKRKKVNQRETGGPVRMIKRHRI